MANTAMTFNVGRQTPLVAQASISLAQMATSATAVVAIQLPINSIVTGGFIVVDTAYDTTGTATVTVGDSGSASRYLGSTNLKATGRTALVPTGYINTGGLDISLTPTLADTAATVGAVRVVVEYIIDGRATEVQPN